eukprot:gene12608-biopygen10048
MCSKGGFYLHKFVSNSKEVLKAIPEFDRAEGVKEMDLDLDSLPIERTLRVQWCVKSDCFQFSIVLQDKPCTRRGILSTVSSIFDPLGFVAPLLLQGKSILQELCCLNLDWDDPIPENVKSDWKKWRCELEQLQRIRIQRCYKPEGFGRIVRAELHHFSDASVKGYGQCSYLRLKDAQNNNHCSLVMGKSTVAPLKPVTIPRLELAAAVYSEIQDQTLASQWKYVESKENPADEASRGMKANELTTSRWFRGPEFLWEDESKWPANRDSFEVVEVVKEIKKSVTMATSEVIDMPSLAERIKRFSNWY